MKRPTWATVVGILAMIFGLMDILGAAQKMALPSMFEMQQQMTKEMASVNDSALIGPMKEVMDLFKSMQKEFQFPEWYKTWATVLGLISMAVAGLYLLSGIFLILMKPSAPRLFYLTIAVSIIWALVLAVVYVKSGAAILMGQLPALIASIVIDVVLLIVVLTGNKEAFCEGAA